MNPTRRAAAVIVAGSLVLFLAASLLFRVTAGSRGPGNPGGFVPSPKPIQLADLGEPFCWGCSWNENVALEFQVDLDLLAPLGTGKANAAEFFADFARGEARFGEGREGYIERMVEIEIDGDSWRVLPGDEWRSSD